MPDLEKHTILFQVSFGEATPSGRVVETAVVVTVEAGKLNARGKC